MRQQLSRRCRPAADRGSLETGAGQFSSIFGLAFFLGMLFLGTGVLLTLYRASAVQAAANDAAHATAQAASGTGGQPCGPALLEHAAARAELLLGSQAKAEVSCVGADALRVTVNAPGVPIAGLVGLGSIQRSAEVRVETAGSLR